jgi:hypothetical protein
MAGMLFGVKPFDPVTFASVSLLLSLVALFACYIPVSRGVPDKILQTTNFHGAERCVSG